MEQYPAENRRNAIELNGFTGTELLRYTHSPTLQSGVDLFHTDKYLFCRVGGSFDGKEGFVGNGQYSSQGHGRKKPIAV
jgi:hypothetical protein